MNKDKVYKLGAYGAYPLLAAAGALLLSRADSTGAMVAAAAVLTGVLILSAFLGRYCRRCGEKLLPRLMRLMIMPVAVMMALGFRTAQLPGQYLAFVFMAAAAILFNLAWQFSAPAQPTIEEKDLKDEDAKSGSKSEDSRLVKR